MIVHVISLCVPAVSTITKDHPKLSSRATRSSVRSSCVYEPTVSSLARTVGTPSIVALDKLCHTKRKYLESSEDIELRAMEASRKEISMMRTRNMAALERSNRESRSFSLKSLDSVYSSKPLTIAHSPKFGKSKRLKPIRETSAAHVNKERNQWKAKKLTNPQSPKLNTMIRANNHAKAPPLNSEEMEILEHQQYQFKALVYRKEVPGTIRPSRRTHLVIEPTHVKPFHFATDDRFRQASSSTLPLVTDNIKKENPIQSTVGIKSKNEITRKRRVRKLHPNTSERRITRSMTKKRKLPELTQPLELNAKKRGIVEAICSPTKKNVLLDCPIRTPSPA